MAKAPEAQDFEEPRVDELARFVRDDHDGALRADHGALGAREAQPRVQRLERPRQGNSVLAGGAADLQPEPAPILPVEFVLVARPDF